MSNTVIQVENLWKEYRLGTINHHSLTRDLQSWWSRVRGKEDPNSQIDSANHQSDPEDRFWALQNISFEVKQGDILGIIGRNGAGKSTLLKILSQVTSPTRGEVRFNGRIASLLEVGTGFHPELTGRENIYLNGAILGMSRYEINLKMCEIIAFSEIEQFVDTPVKRYSSGMYVRLAFAVAAHLDSEILILDEVLTVGDFAFRKKCIGKMGEIGKSGRTIILVSHDMNQIKLLCDSAVLLDQGRLGFYGESQQVTDYYVKNWFNNSVINNPHLRNRDTIQDTNGPKIEEVSLFDANGGYSTCFCSTDKINVILKIRPFTNSDKPFAAIYFIHDLYGQQVAVGASYPMQNIMYKQSVEEITCEIDPTSLLAGTYFIRFVLHIPHYEMFDDWNNAINFEITENDYHKTGYSYPGIWTAQQYVKSAWNKQDSD